MTQASAHTASPQSRLGDLFGDTDDLRVALAPGRVNLIGEHTDYNDGWALPMAIDRYVSVAFRPRDDRAVRAHAVAFDETEAFDIDALSPPGNRRWVSYVAGVVWSLVDAGHQVSGIDCVINGNLPLGAGLSSSAALEMAVARALCDASGIPWSPPEMALLGQRAENAYVGVNCGAMDQLTSATSLEGCALLLDCRSTATEPVPLPSAARVVVMNTGVRRSLADSEYNNRRASCEAAVEVLRRLEPGVEALRDVDRDLLAAAGDQLDDLTRRRATHVVDENVRPALMAAAFRAGDLQGAGRLMNESHASLRDLYEVSSPELDLVTDLARRHPACFGARLTGAGFGGCAIALIAANGAEEFVDQVHRNYRAAVDLPSEFLVCEPVAGARLREPLDRENGH